MAREVESLKSPRSTFIGSGSVDTAATCERQGQLRFAFSLLFLLLLYTNSILHLLAMELKQRGSMQTEPSRQDYESICFLQGATFKSWECTGNLEEEKQS